jgi:hypothetical protein
MVDGLIQQLPMLTRGGKVIKSTVVATPVTKKKIKNVDKTAVEATIDRNYPPSTPDTLSHTPTAPSTADREQSTPSMSLVGRHVVFTGTMKSMNRKKAQEIVEAMGETNMFLQYIVFLIIFVESRWGEPLDCEQLGEPLGGLQRRRRANECQSEQGGQQGRRGLERKRVDAAAERGDQ